MWLGLLFSILSLSMSSYGHPQMQSLGSVVDFVSSLQRDSYDLALQVDEKL